MHTLWFGARRVCVCVCVCVCVLSRFRSTVTLITAAVSKVHSVNQNKRGIGLMRTKKDHKETAFDITKHAPTCTSIGIKFNI